jgi:hypothetical protein
MKVRWFWHSREYIPSWRIRAGDWVPAGLWQWLQVITTEVEWGVSTRIVLSDGTESVMGHTDEACRRV